MVGYSSGQRGQTVNLLAKPSKVRILLPPRQADKNACTHAEVAQLVEHQPSKLIVAGSNPVFRSKLTGRRSNPLTGVFLNVAGR